MLRGFSSRVSAPLLRMPVFTHADYTLRLPAKHRFPMERYAKVAAYLESVLPEPRNIDIRVDGRLASKEQICAVHESNYVQRFLDGDMLDNEMRTIGFPWSEALVRRTLRITGATIQCTDLVLRGKLDIAGNLAGGTHHAFAAHGEGYCIFNDIAVAARYAQRHYSQGQIVVLDLDVHQGNGTADIFANDPSVFTLSIHCERNYPWHSRRPSDLDIGVSDDCSSADYLAAVRQGLDSIDSIFPEHAQLLVFFQAGVDPLLQDRLGRLKLNRQDLRRRNALVYDWCVRRGAKTVVTMGGGYSSPIELSVQAHADVFLAAAAATVGCRRASVMDRSSQRSL